MKMLNNVLEVDAFAILRIPIQSRPCMKMGEDDLQYVARLLERPVQVRHPPHHAEDVAVAEPVDGVDAPKKKVIKTVTFLPLP